MRQHNQWKIRQLQKNFVKIVLWGFGLGLLFFTVLFHRSISFDFVSGAIGVCSFLFGLVIMLFEHFWWKKAFVQKVLYSTPFLKGYWTPILEGRWEGTLVRDGMPHAFVLEITQSYTSISCVTFSKHSSSTALAAEILFDEDANNYKLIFYWGGKTTSVQPNEGDLNRFEGFTSLQIVFESGIVKRLKGEYFTDRRPKQTKGTLDLERKQFELKKSFD